MLCLDNNIVPFLLPPNTTRDLQPMDVGVYGPYQQHYGKTVDNLFLASHGLLHITKDNFWLLLKEARKRIFTPHIIKSAWRKSGLFPLNRTRIMAKSSIFEDENAEAAAAQIQLDANIAESTLPSASPKTIHKASHIVKVIVDHCSCPITHKGLDLLLQAYEELFTTNMLLREDLEQVNGVLKAKKQKTRVKLHGWGVLSAQDALRLREHKLKKMAEEERLAQGRLDRAKRKAEKEATALIEASAPPAKRPRGRPRKVAKK